MHMRGKTICEFSGAENTLGDRAEIQCGWELRAKYRNFGTFHMHAIAKGAHACHSCSTAALNRSKSACRIHWGICPLCRAHYSNRHSFRTHYQASRNECKRSKNAEDSNRERTKKNLAAAKRLADPFVDNDRKRKRQGYDYKDSDWRACGYDTYEDYMYDKARGMFCGGTCKD